MGSVEHAKGGGRAIIATLLTSFGAASLGLAADAPITCTTCHATQAGQLAASVHAELVCQACHAGANDYALEADEVERYKSRSVTSGILFDHGGTFTGKPSRADIPNLCGGCHADVERMNPYGLRTDQLARYWTSGHGKTLREKGDDRVAICVDCHGGHDILPGHEPASKTYPLNVPDTCGACHGDAALMEAFGHSTAQVEEYRLSVHGRLLEEQHDMGAPTCATCHGNHSATPPGFKDVRSVCGQCHQHAAKNFATSIHASQPDHAGCVQCHGGGADRHFHLIERITKPTGVMIQRYAHLLTSNPDASAEAITASIHPAPRKIIEDALPSCMACHDDLEDDESLPKLFGLIDKIATAERNYVRTAKRLDDVGRGVLLVDDARFLFEDAKTHLIELAPLQHTLDNELVAKKVDELDAVCEAVNAELTELENGLAWRRSALLPIWIFASVFAIILYVKFKQLKRIHVKPLPRA